MYFIFDIDLHPTWYTGMTCLCYVADTNTIDTI